MPVLALWPTLAPHPACRRAVLAKHYIGDLAAEEGTREPEHLVADDEVAEGSFYAVLKQRVQTHMQENKVWRLALLQSAQVERILLRQRFGSCVN